jgi:RND superfamily putative drug exporter
MTTTNDSCPGRRDVTVRVAHWSAAIVLVSVCTTVARLHLIGLKQLTHDLTVAVRIDAMVVHAIVLPAVVILLGAWIWWSGERPDQPIESRRPEDAELIGMAA